MILCHFIAVGCAARRPAASFEPFFFSIPQRSNLVVDLRQSLPLHRTRAAPRPRRRNRESTPHTGMANGSSRTPSCISPLPKITETPPPELAMVVFGSAVWLQRGMRISSSVHPYCNRSVVIWTGSSQGTLSGGRSLVLISTIVFRPCAGLRNKCGLLSLLLLCYFFAINACTGRLFPISCEKIT
jgi:hypothetical protein